MDVPVSVSYVHVAGNAGPVLYVLLEQSINIVSPSLSLKLLY